ncbi:hypothetical protein MLD38_012135 [Melastoma candidum]|uniref:Uncharacterized protein n=1 Tax=Melastoma candidum TaxID=119954 RepID=A0ACB9R4Y1_9MYRT|nr:hypothetical protein MLD38_012135 [Melastoma candidum]
MEDGKANIRCFDGKHFGYWKLQITDMLYAKELEDAMLKEKPEEIDEKTWKKLDRRALGLIRNTISMDVASHVAEETTTFGFMKRLSDLYEKPSSSNKIHLLRRLFQLQMAEGAPVTEHVAEFNHIVNQLKAITYPLDDELLAHCLLISMPDSWSTTVEVISGQEKMTLDFVRDRIINEGIRRNEQGDTTGSALSVERGREIKRGENRGRSKSKGRSKSCSKSGTGCWNCWKKGHFKRDCKAPKKTNKKGDESNSVNAATKEDSDDALVLCVNSSIESWILDSGASFHSTSSKELMINFVSGEYGKMDVT